MAHCVTKTPEPFLIAGGRLRVHAVPAAKDNLVWLIASCETGEAAVVDGPSDEEVLEACALHGYTLTTVLTTHTHWDHVGLHGALQARGRLKGMRVIGARAAAQAIPGLNEPVEEGDTLEVLGVPVTVWRTEGHQDGHLSYVFEGAVFCGDVLFAGGCGYMFDGPAEVFFQSLCRLATLPGDTLVCCAHEYTLDNLAFALSVEPHNEALRQRVERALVVRAQGGCTVPSTVEEERATNPFLRPGSAELQAHVGGGPRPPAGWFAATRELKNARRYPPVSTGAGWTS